VINRYLSDEGCIYSETAGSFPLSDIRIPINKCEVDGVLLKNACRRLETVAMDIFVLTTVVLMENKPRERSKRQEEGRQEPKENEELITWITILFLPVPSQRQRFSNILSFTVLAHTRLRPTYSYMAPSGPNSLTFSAATCEPLLPRYCLTC
jgi:hypothetical protein